MKNKKGFQKEIWKFLINFVNCFEFYEDSLNKFEDKVNVLFCKKEILYKKHFLRKKSLKI